MIKFDLIQVKVRSLHETPLNMVRTVNVALKSKLLADYYGANREEHK